MTATYTPNQRTKTFYQLMDDCLEKRLKLATDEEAIAAFDEALDGMKELAIGIWCEKEVMTASGEMVKKVYQRAPDKKAIAMLANMYNFDPAVISNALLASARAEGMIVQQKLMIQQKFQAKAITAKTARETAAMDASYATEQEFTNMAISLSSTLINFLQATPVTDLPRTEEMKQKWIERLNHKVQDVLQDLLKAKTDGISNEDEE